MASIGRAVQWLWREFGLASVWETGLDAWLVILSRTCRMFAFGAVSLIIALFLSALGFSDFQIGLFMTLTLAGDVILSLVLALVADHIGRRRVLNIGGLLMVLSGVVFAFNETYWILVLAAVVGVISATGGDFGPFRSVEESTLSHLTTGVTRSDVLSWYVTTSTLGSAVGTELAGRLVGLLRKIHHGSKVRAYHSMFWIYVTMGVFSVALTLLMSRKCEIADQPATRTDDETSRPLLGDGANGTRNEVHEETNTVAGRDAPEHGASNGNGNGHGGEGASSKIEPKASWWQKTWRSSKLAQISPESLPVVIRIWVLLTIDSLADGMVSYSLTNYYLARKFDLSESYLGDIMSISYLLMSISTIFAGPLAKRLGLVNTMVFTHLPSSAAVLLFPIPKSLALTMLLLYVRTGLNNMDQGPRAAFIAAVVKPRERTAVMGITGMLRTLASAVGPSLTGWLADMDKFWIAYVVAGALRIGYDLGLFVQFVGMNVNFDEVNEDDSAQPGEVSQASAASDSGERTPSRGRVSAS